MLSKEEIEKAIKITETQTINYQTCEKLAVFYYLLDRLYPEQTSKPKESKNIVTDSEFLRAVENVELDDALMLIDELLETVKLLHVDLYNAFMKKLNALLTTQ